MVSIRCFYDTTNIDRLSEDNLLTETTLRGKQGRFFYAVIKTNGHIRI